MESYLEDKKKKKIRFGFLSALAQFLETEGISCWHGNSMAKDRQSPKHSLICLYPQGGVQNLSLGDTYSPGPTLVRIKINIHPLPTTGPFVNIAGLRRGKSREVTCLQDDLTRLLPCLAGLLLQRIEDPRDYIWDEQAALTLDSDTQQRFDRQGTTGLRP